MTTKILLLSLLATGIISAGLIISQPSVLAGGPPDPADITGVEWKWEQTLYNDDSKAVPSDPSHYTVTFKSDGTLAVRADCNRAGGAYTLQEKRLTITVTHSTMAMCPPESLDSQFLKGLDAAALYFFQDGYLYLDLKHDTGTMKFRP